MAILLKESFGNPKVDEEEVAETVLMVDRQLHTGE